MADLRSNWSTARPDVLRCSPFGASIADFQSVGESEPQPLQLMQESGFSKTKKIKKKFRPRLP